MEVSQNFKRIPFICSDEYDVLTPARKFYCYTDRSRVCKQVKKRYNKRFRKAAKERLYENIKSDLW